MQPMIQADGKVYTHTGVLERGTGRPYGDRRSLAGFIVGVVLGATWGYGWVTGWMAPAPAQDSAVEWLVRFLAVTISATAAGLAGGTALSLLARILVLGLARNSRPAEKMTMRKNRMVISRSESAFPSEKPGLRRE